MTHADIKTIAFMVIVLIAVYSGFYMGKNSALPVNENATIHCEYTFPTLQTVIEP